MRVIGLPKLEAFWQRHRDAEQQLLAWLDDAERSDWNSGLELSQRYSNVRIIPPDRAVFNIRGNRYRLIVRINYAFKWVSIRFIGTHAQYDRIDAESI